MRTGPNLADPGRGGRMVPDDSALERLIDYLKRGGFPPCGRATPTTGSRCSRSTSTWWSCGTWRSATTPRTSRSSASSPLRCSPPTRGVFSVSRLHGSLTTQGWKVGKATLLAFLGHLVDAFLVFLVPMRTRAADAGRIRIVPAREWSYDARRFLWSRRGRGPRPVNRRDHPGSDTQAPGRGPRTFSANSNRIWRKCPPMGACRGPFGHYSSELRSVAAPRGQIRLFPVLLADIFRGFKSNRAKMSAGEAASPPTATPQPATAWSLRAP